MQEGRVTAPVADHAPHARQLASNALVRLPPRSAWLLAGVLAVVYYGSSRLGLALAASGEPVLWPPAAVLLAALALTPTSWWWLEFAAVLPVELLAQMQAGASLPLALGSYVSGAGEAWLGAVILRHISPGRNLNTVRSVIGFCCAAVLAPLLVSAAEAGMFWIFQREGAEFAARWRVRFFAHVVAILAFVPLFLTWWSSRARRLRHAPANMIELGALFGALLGVGVLVFDSAVPESASASLLYLPMPLLIWAALRFGPAVASAAYSMVVFLVVWGAAHGRGSALTSGANESPLTIQLFLLTLAVPLLVSALIEEKREAERRLHASQELFATAFRESPDPIAISRRSDGNIVEANARWLDLLGYPEDALAWGAVAPLEEHLDDASRERLRTLVVAGHGVQDLELSLHDRQGRGRTVLLSLAAVHVRGHECHVLTLRDLTPQREAEKEAQDQRRQLTHLTRVASLTDFSSTIAHELNQPLTAILSNAQAALRFLAQDPPQVGEIRTILGEIADADKRAGLLIHHLRLLLKKGQEEFVQLDLNHLVEDVLNLIRGEFLVRNVHVRASYSPDLLPVTGDRVQLQQLVLNLVCNACEAMQTSNAPERTLTVTTMHGPAHTVEVVVSDTGPGLPPALLERVFEPFFTTKENGLGLGLSICRKIAKAHGGQLLAESREGQGATFRVALPAAMPTRLGPGAPSVPARSQETAATPS